MLICTFAQLIFRLLTCHFRVHACFGLIFLVLAFAVWPSRHGGWGQIIHGMPWIRDFHISSLIAVEAIMSHEIWLKKAKSTARASLMIAAMVISTSFVPTAMSLAANLIFRPRDHTASTKSKAAIPMRVALVWSVIVTCVGPGRVNDGLLLCYCAVAPLLKRFGVGTRNDLVLEFVMKGPRADVALVLLARSAMIDRKEHPWADLPFSICHANLWLALYFVVLQIEHYGERAAALMLRSRLPFGLAVFGYWIISLYILTLL